MIFCKKFFCCLSTLVCVQILTAHLSFAQLDSIYDQSVYRTFIVHLPIGYSTSNQYPIVINLHGLNSNAGQQQSYSQFDNVADTMDFIVVYPNGIGGQWNVTGSSDVTFISHLIDTIRSDYSCNSCLFITGISYGGFMTYKLACSLPQPITAIANVAGNMAVALQNTCVITNGLPVMHFHGTADVIVNYNGVPPLIPPVDTTINWWVNQNSCTTSTSTPLPDINTSDSSNVILNSYTNGVGGSSVMFYKIINGGHTWPGSFPVPPLGITNQDIEASGEMGTFFRNYCPVAQSVSEINRNPLIIFPNPASDHMIIALPQQEFQIELYDVTGRKIFSAEKISGRTEIDCSNFSDGIYFIRVESEKYSFNKKIIIAR